MKILASTERKITNDKNSESVPHLEIAEVTLLKVTIGNVEEFCIHISPTIFIFLKTFNLAFSYTEVLFIDQKSKPLEIEDKININLVIIDM